MDHREKIVTGLIRGIKIAGYIFVSIFVGVAVNPQFQAWVLANPQFVEYGAAINIILGIAAGVLKQYLPENNTVQKVL